MNTKRAFWLDPDDPDELLQHVVGFLAHHSFIVFEGDLSQCDFSAVRSYAPAPIPEVKRETDPSEGEQIVLPLEMETEAHILSQVLTDNRFLDEIAAIQIVRDGEVLFLAGDHFDSECVSVGDSVPEDFLKDLVQRGVLKSYRKG
jgi:hypothetical protein